jgi:enoyl-CoA hydratase
MSGGETDEEFQQAMAEVPDIQWQALLRHNRPLKPIIAAVEGFAVAGGTEILQGTDIRVAGLSAKFAVAEVKRSLYPMGGSAVRLARQIPYTEAADILLTGRNISATEAKELGLIGHVVDDGLALERALEIAATIAENGPLAVEAVLRTLHETQGMTESEAFEFEAPIGMKVFGSNDASEGPRAFSEKRPANYTRT